MYQKAVLDLIRFDSEDVITTSVEGVPDVVPPSEPTPPAPSDDSVDSGQIV